MGLAATQMVVKSPVAAAYKAHIQHLYRATLKSASDWYRHDQWRVEALQIRYQFELHKTTESPAAMSAHLAELQYLEASWRHPDPYRRYCAWWNKMGAFHSAPLMDPYRTRGGHRFYQAEILTRYGTLSRLVQRSLPARPYPRVFQRPRNWARMEEIIWRGLDGKATTTKDQRPSIVYSSKVNLDFDHVDNSSNLTLQSARWAVTSCRLALVGKILAMERQYAKWNLQQHSM